MLKTVLGNIYVLKRLLWKK